MARLDVYPNPIVADRRDFPYVIEIQSDLLYQFVERVCVPLAGVGVIPGVTARFNPALSVSRKSVHLHPLGIAVFHVQELRKPVTNARNFALEIDTAIDMLLRGY